MPKKVGILGSGTVAQTLAGGFVKHGFSVKMGTTKPEKLNEFIKKSAGAVSAGSFTDAAKFGDLVVLVVKGNAALDVVKAEAANLKGKTVIDVTNPIDNAPPVNGVIKYFTRLDRSLMEDLQQAVPDALFVKSFNSIGAAFMVNPDFGGQKPTMFICGNNDQAKKEVAAIVEKFGFEVEDMGAVEAARAIEPLCMLWCIPGLRNNEWSHAFKLLKK
ncbi:MAG: NAD(P)-binding domain-containing protein [Chitinivibrionales bacterium]